jgi:hypothetical protein
MSTPTLPPPGNAPAFALEAGERAVVTKDLTD